MAFFRFKGKYLYLVKTYREDGKVKHRQKYIGKRNLSPTQIKGLNVQLRQKNPRLYFNDVFKSLCEDKAKAKGGTWKDYYDQRLKEMVRHISWIKKYIEASKCINGRVQKSHPPGTLNKTALYELLKVKDEKKRLKVYGQYIKHGFRYSWQMRFFAGNL